MYDRNTCHQAKDDHLTALMPHHGKKQAEKLTAKEFGVSQRWVQILFNRHKRGKL